PAHLRRSRCMSARELRGFARRTTPTWWRVYARPAGTVEAGIWLRANGPPLDRPVPGRPLLGLAVLVVLRKIRPEIVDLFFVLDAGDRHLGTGNLGLRGLDVFLEHGLVAGNVRTLVGLELGLLLAC